MDKLDSNNQQNMQNEDMELTFEEIINAASGLTLDGQPATAGNIMISHAIDKDTIKNDSEASFGDAVLDFFASGGCMVVQADFSKRSTRDFERVIEICSDYMIHVGDEAWHENRDLMVIMVPLAFYGDISIVLQDLVYFTAINLDDNGTRLIMCFNNMMTRLMENEDIDYNKIALELRNEDMREEEQLREELQAAEDELKQLEESENSYASAITQGFTHENLMNRNFETYKEEPKNSGFRFSNDDDE